MKHCSDAKLPAEKYIDALMFPVDQISWPKEEIDLTSHCKLLTGFEVRHSKHSSDKHASESSTTCECPNCPVTSSHLKGVGCRRRRKERPDADPFVHDLV